MIDVLRDHLIAADYTVDNVLERLGDAGQAGLLRNSTMPARMALGDDRSPLATLTRLFPLAMVVPLRAAATALPLAQLVDTGLVSVTDEQVRAKIDIRPYGFATPDGQWEGWVVSDHTPGLDHDRRPTPHDHVLSVSPASTTLAQMTIDDQVGSALDLGTGCGVQSLHLSTHAHTVTATDVNPRAHRLARITAALNRIDVDLRDGSLFEPVVHERFDLVVSNPPYVMSPPSRTGRLQYREAGFAGDELVHRLVAESTRHLNPGGTLQLLANWAITDRPWQDRIAEWAPPGADFWVIERERLDPYAYIELWLGDAGLAGDPSWGARYREWLEYFEHLGIRSVGMGWITVVNAHRDQPEVTIESWPHEVHQPVGPAIAAHRRDVDHARRCDAHLLATNWALRDDIVQETLGSPGAADPQYVVLRQTVGLKRAIQVDTALGAVLGACDGSMTLHAIVKAVAILLDDDPIRLQDELLPTIRTAVKQGYLHPVHSR